MKLNHPDPELNDPLTDQELDFLERFLAGDIPAPVSKL